MYVRQLKKIQVAQSVTVGGNAPRMIASDDVEGLESLLKYVPAGIVSSEDELALLQLYCAQVALSPHSSSAFQGVPGR